MTGDSRSWPRMTPWNCGFMVVNISSGCPFYLTANVLNSFLLNSSLLSYHYCISPVFIVSCIFSSLGQIFLLCAHLSHITLIHPLISHCLPCCLLWAEQWILYCYAASSSHKWPKCMSTHKCQPTPTCLHTSEGPIF